MDGKETTVPVVIAVLLFAGLFALIAAPAGAEPDTCEVRNPPPLADDKPQDLDDDCLYEDIDGDGRVTILDTQLLFQEMQTNKVQNHPEAFDFSEVSPAGKVTIFDVAAHWLKNVR